MKNLLYFLLFLSTQSLAQNKIVGYVKLQNSGKSPLPNVEVYSIGAQTTYTNDKGYFELQFANKKVGDLVASIEFSLEGYSVLNEEKCQGLVLAKDATLAPLMVVMSKKSDFRQRKAEYYGVIVNNANQNFEAERKKLQTQINQLATNDEERRILLSKIAELEEEKQNLVERADALAEQFAEINLDAASQLAQKALALFKEGKVKEAIATLDDEVLDQNMREAQKNKANAEQKLMQADSAIQQGVENYMVKARLQKADLQWKASYRSYIKALEGDSTNVDNLWEVAYYVAELNDQKRAIQYYEQALRHEVNEVNRGSLNNNTGNAYRANNDYAKAQDYLLAALEIRERLAKGNPARFEPDLAMTQNNLGLLYADLNQYGKAEQSYLAALEIRERLAKGNPARFEPDLAMTQNNLGNLYRNINQYGKAEQSFLAALEIKERLAKGNPARFEPDLAMTQNNLGNLYRNINQYGKAEQSFLPALEIQERLAKGNPARFEPDLAMTQNNLGNLYRNINQYGKAEQSFLPALEIQERLAKDNPARFEPDVAMTQNNLGTLYQNINQYGKAEQSFLVALEIRERFAKGNPARFEPDVAMTQNNLGNLYRNINQYGKAEQSYLAALEIQSRLAKDNPARFEPGVAMTQNNLGLLYADLNQYGKAEQSYLAALEIQERLAKGNPARFEPDMATTQNNLGNLYSDINQYGKAEQSYLAALEIYERLAKGNLARFEPYVATTQNNLVILYFSLDRKEEALELLGKTLPIYRRLAVENSARYDIEIARTLYIKGIILVNIGKQSAANEALLEAKQIAEKYPQIPFSQNVIDTYNQYYKEENEQQTNPLIVAISDYEQKVEASTAYSDKVLYQEKVVELLDSLSLQNPNNQKITDYTANQYGSLAWFYLFTKEFASAETAAQKALAISNETEWVNTNLALALLYQGKYKQAEAIYLRLKDKEYGEATYRETFLKDLEELEAAGVTHKDVKKVRKLLEGE